MSRQLTRAEFIRLSALGITGAALTACNAAPVPAATQAPAAPTTAPAAPAPTAAPKKVTKVTLKIMHNWAAGDPKNGPLTSVFKDVMAQNPEISIQEETFTDADIPTKVEVAFKANEEPDVVLINWFQTTPTWTENGLTIPIDDLLGKWGLQDTFLAAATGAFTNTQGKIGAFPLEGYHWPMWYNTKILKQASVDIPKTHADLLAAIPKIKAAGFAPIGAGVKDSQGWAFLGLILASAVDEATHMAMYKEGQGWEKALAGFEAFVQIRDAGGISEAATGLDTAGSLEEFNAGKTAMLHGGSWSYATLPPAMGPDVALAGFPLPANSPHKIPVGFAGFGAKGVWITRNGSAKMDAIEKLIKTLYTPKAMAKFVEDSAMILPLKGEVPVDAGKVPPLLVKSLQGANSIEWLLPGQGSVPSAVRPNLGTIVQEAYVQGTAQEIHDKIVAAYKAVA